jgi:glycerol dehydrogenase-like iron-containing ADH family enzyme
MAALAQEAELYQIPSLPSVNACFTHMTAIREGDGVHYYGDAIPEMVFVDYDLMKAAPVHLVRGGIGDVLSCHTVRWDWSMPRSAVTRRPGTILRQRVAPFHQLPARAGAGTVQRRE